MTKSKSIKLGKTADTIVTYIILIVIAAIFFFPCLWLILASFSAEGSLYTLKGFSRKSLGLKIIKTFLPIPQCITILFGLRIPYL